MSALKIHLEMAEMDAVKRYADSLNVLPEDVAYAALNRLMLDARNPAVKTDIRETRDWRHDNLPLWSDSARSVRAYEAQLDDEPTQSRHL